MSEKSLRRDMPQLDYAPKPPIHRRRTFRRIVYFVIVAALLVPAMWAGRRAYERATLLYWQRRCADFSMPPGTVAYDENPATTPALWANVSAGYNYFQFIDRSTGKPILVLMRPRGQWERSIRQCTGGLNQLGSVFLHARRAGADQPRRLVCVSQ